MPEEQHLPDHNRKQVRLFLCGDVMCGRGIDQVLAHPCSPEIYEDYMRSAGGYVLLAEQANGPIPRRNGPSYVWGAAPDQLEGMQPDARIINLETAVTRSNNRANKGINYRMSPENAECLLAARIDCCALANNHVLDWGRAGLLETLTTLQRLNVKATGAGRNDLEARAPAVLNLGKARLLIFSFGSTSSGIPFQWAATPDAPDVLELDRLDDEHRIIFQRVRDRVLDRGVEVAALLDGLHRGIMTEHDFDLLVHDRTQNLIDRCVDRAELGVEIGDLFGRSAQRHADLQVGRLLVVGIGIRSIHHLSLPVPILRREFWLYVWRACLPDGRLVHYVGMTGDTGSKAAQSAMNRLTAHLGPNVNSNALRKYLNGREAELEDCRSLDFFAFGPVYQKINSADYAAQRGRVAAIEKRLWTELRDAGYEMLNPQPKAAAELDETRWRDICRAFKDYFPRLTSNQK
jgi:poly-gamma-glutamate synthesis protein (capsule biosynthesis protein)